MPPANPGEVWIVDLGLAAKVRSCLVLGDCPKDDELALIFLSRNLGIESIFRHRLVSYGIWE